MAKRIPSRKARFKAALALDGMTGEAWAKREGVTYPHLYMVLQDDRQSRKLTEKIEAYIREVEARTRFIAA